jgi:hypothetical protein
MVKAWEIARRIDPEKLTVGDLADILAFVDRTPQEQRGDSTIGPMWSLYEAKLIQSPGYTAFLAWKAAARLQRRSRLEAACEFLTRLGEQTGSLDRELRTVPVLDAVRRLGQSEGTEARSPSGTKVPVPAATIEGDNETPKPPGPPVILGKRSNEPIVKGRRKKRLTDAQYDVITALLTAGDDGLSKDSLATESGHGDAHRVLRRLADSDTDWKSVILMAEKPGGRYRIRTANLPTSPDVSRKAPTKRNKG